MFNYFPLMSLATFQCTLQGLGGTQLARPAEENGKQNIEEIARRDNEVINIGGRVIHNSPGLYRV
jgi:hypothetical protein